MPDQHDWLLSLIHGSSKRGDPVLQDRLRPFLLFHAARGRYPLLPAALPMVRAGIAVARHDENVCVLSFHGPALPISAARCNRTNDTYCFQMMNTLFLLR